MDLTFKQAPDWPTGYLDIFEPNGRKIGRISNSNPADGWLSWRVGENATYEITVSAKNANEAKTELCYHWRQIGGQAVPTS